jgi:hypothetical protein
MDSLHSSIEKPIAASRIRLKINYCTSDRLSKGAIHLLTRIQKINLKTVPVTGPFERLFQPQQKYIAGQWETGPNAVAICSCALIPVKRQLESR